LVEIWSLPFSQIFNMSHTPDTHAEPAGFNPLAGIAAIILPGAGHVVRGERQRGLLIGGGILGLFFGGMLIGGIDVVDSEEDFPWFIAQSLVGPLAFGVDYVHQHYFKVLAVVEQVTPDGQRMLIETRRSAYPREVRDEHGKPTPAASPTDPPPNTKSLSKTNELGTLFGTIAGMLNVIAVVDAAFPTARRRIAKPAANTAGAREAVKA